MKSSEAPPLIHELMKDDILDIVQVFECLATVIGKVSNASGFSELWLQSEPVVKYHLDKWMKCPQAGDKLAVIL